MNLRETLEHLSQHPDYVDLTQLEGLKIELKYATDDNFMKRNVYGDFSRGFLHRIAAEKLGRAAQLLRKERPGHHLLILDALRPRSIQRVLWRHVEGTPEQGYVANPERGSVHNYGFAVDLTVIDEHDRELDMGTPFDTFLPLSQPRLEDEFIAQGKLARAQHENRLVLRRCMTESGFLQLPHEWWHYDALPGDEVRARFTIVE